MERFINIMVFILDDDKDILELIDHKFKEEKIINYRLFYECSDFLSQLTDNVNLAIIDYRMPDCALNGIEITKKVLERNRMCHVIILSGIDSNDVIIEFMNSGAWRYVQKSKRDFLDKLAHHVKEGLENIKRDIEYLSKLMAKEKEIEKYVSHPNP